MDINEVDFDLIENKPFGRLRWCKIIGVVDSYGAVHSEINTDLWHEQLWPTAKCKWRWNDDKSIWWIALESKPDDEQYESIMWHLEKKYGIKFWENGHHDIDHLMKMWIKEYKTVIKTKP